MSLCERGYGIAGYPVCSGNGKCVDGFCVCHSGWTSIGDFALIDGYDCDLHIPTIKGLSIAYVVMSIPAFVLATRAILKFNVKRRISHADGYAIAVLSSIIFGCVRNVLKIVDPVKYSLDRSVVTTLAFTFFIFSLDWMVLLKCFQMMSFLEGTIKFQAQHKNLKNIIHFTRSVFISVPFIVLVTCLTLDLIGLYALNGEYSFLVGLLYSVILACSAGSQLSIGIAMYETSLSSLNEMHSPEVSSNQNHISDVNSTVFKVKAQYTAWFRAFCTYFTMQCINASWYFIRRKLSYSSLILGIAGNITAFIMLRRDIYEVRVSSHTDRYLVAKVSPYEALEDGNNYRNQGMVSSSGIEAPSRKDNDLNITN